MYFSHLDVGGKVSNELLTTDARPCLPGLGLQLYQLDPQVLGGSREVANLCVGVEAKDLWCVGQWESVYVLQIVVSGPCMMGYPLVYVLMYMYKCMY